MPFTVKWSPLLRALLEITKFDLHKSVPGVGIIRNAGIIQGRALIIWGNTADSMQGMGHQWFIWPLESCINSKDMIVVQGQFACLLLHIKKCREIKVPYVHHYNPLLITTEDFENEISFL